jgi:hypothetical protein
MDPYILTQFIFVGLVLTYGIFMLLYLTDAKKCDKYMSSRDTNFRKVALVLTWIDVVVVGLGLLGIFIALVSGQSSPYMK